MKKLLFLLLFIPVLAKAQYPAPAGVSNFISIRAYYIIIGSDTTVYMQNSKGDWFPVSRGLKWTSNFKGVGTTASKFDLADTIHTKYGIFDRGVMIGDSTSFNDYHFIDFRKVTAGVIESRFGASTFGGVFMSDFYTANGSITAKGIRQLYAHDYPEYFTGGGANGYPIVTTKAPFVSGADTVFVLKNGVPGMEVGAGGGGSDSTLYKKDGTITDPLRTVTIGTDTLLFKSNSATDSVAVRISPWDAFSVDNFSKADTSEAFLSVSGGQIDIEGFDTNYGATISANKNIAGLQMYENATGHSKHVSLPKAGDGIDPGIIFINTIDQHGARYSSYLDYANADSLTLMPKQYNDAHYAAVGSGGTTTNPLTFNNSGTGDASGSTFDGSAAKTLSYNSIGAVPTTRTVNGKALSGNITLGLASSDFANQGTTTTLLHGNASGNPSFGAVSLTADVTGLLPIANGGTGTASPGIVAGTNVTVSGTWPNQTINSTSGTVSGTTNYIPKFTGSSTIGNSLLYDNGSGLTLGTTTNSGIQFDATGTGRFQGNLGVGQLAAVSGTPGVSTLGTGGALPAGTYYYKIVVVDYNGNQTTGSTEVTATVSGTTSKVTLTWTAVSMATSYNIYRGTTPGGENIYFNSTTNSYVDVNASSTGGSVPTVNNTAAVYMNTNGTVSASYLGLVGLGGGNVATNIAVGTSAILSNTTGANTTAVGYQAGMNLISPSVGYNTLIGANAGASATGGAALTHAVFVGNQAGQNSGGTFNTFMGDAAGQSITASYNTALGGSALQYSTSGANNTIIGFGAASYNPTTSNFINSISNSVFIGWNANPTATGHTNEIGIGYNAQGNGSNTTTIGNSSTINYYQFGAGITKTTTAAINSTATATAAQLATGWVTSTSAAGTTITLPTATLMATQILGVLGTTFEFRIDNSAGANTVTLVLGSGMTQLTAITGANTLTVASGSLGVFRLEFTSTSACFFSRIE